MRRLLVLVLLAALAPVFTPVAGAAVSDRQRQASAPAQINALADRNAAGKERIAAGGRIEQISAWVDAP